VRSVKYHEIHCSDTVALTVSRTINNILPRCLPFVDNARSRSELITTRNVETNLRSFVSEEAACVCVVDRTQRDEHHQIKTFFGIKQPLHNLRKLCERYIKARFRRSMSCGTKCHSETFLPTFLPHSLLPHDPYRRDTSPSAILIMDVSQEVSH